METNTDSNQTIKEIPTTESEELMNTLAVSFFDNEIKFDEDICFVIHSSFSFFKQWKDSLENVIFVVIVLNFKEL